MDTNLRAHFDRAVGDDPGADPGELAHAAIAEGRRMRRRRRQTAAAGVAAGVMTVLGTLAGMNLLTGAPKPAAPPMTVAAAMMPVAAPSCTANPVEHDATDVLVFLTPTVTVRQRSALDSALHHDARVARVVTESREQAYERFRSLWADSPDLVAAVSVDQLPESFRLRLADPARYVALRADYSAMGGVDMIIGRICPPSAPIGGIR